MFISEPVLEINIFCKLIGKFFFFRFIKLRLNHWSHIDYFYDVFTTFLVLEICSCRLSMGQKTQISLKDLQLCSKDEQMSSGFEMT